MPGVIANPIWGVTTRDSYVQLRTDQKPRTNFLYKNRLRLAPPFAPATLAFGISNSIDWAYRVLSYVPPEPDPIGGGGGYRPSVGQLTP
jgi:hypothetical protein